MREAIPATNWSAPNGGFPASAFLEQARPRARSFLNLQVARKSDSRGTASIEEAPSESRDIAPRSYSVPTVSEKIAGATFSSLQEWEGYVVEIGSDSFSAFLIDITAKRNRPEERIDFPIADLSSDDLKLLREGAIFRWSIGYEKSHGTKKRVSQIVFRRLPAWTKADLNASRQKVDDLMKNIEWE